MFEDIFEARDDSMYDPEDDATAYKSTDTRKPKLTLQILNNLRKYREFKKNEMAKRDSVVAIVYAKPAGEDQNGLM